MRLIISLLYLIHLKQSPDLIGRDSYVYFVVDYDLINVVKSGFVFVLPLFQELYKAQVGSALLITGVEPTIACNQGKHKICQGNKAAEQHLILVCSIFPVHFHVLYCFLKFRQILKREKEEEEVGLHSSTFASQDDTKACGTRKPYNLPSLPFRAVASVLL